MRQVSRSPSWPGTHCVNKVYRLALACCTLGVVFLTPCKSASCSHWIHNTRPRKSSWSLKPAFSRGLSCSLTCQSMHLGSLNASYWPPDIPFGKPCLSSVISARPMAPKLVSVQVLILMLHNEKALLGHRQGDGRGQCSEPASHLGIFLLNLLHSSPAPVCSCDSAHPSIAERPPSITLPHCLSLHHKGPL